MEINSNLVKQKLQVNQGQILLVFPISFQFCYNIYYKS